MKKIVFISLMIAALLCGSVAVFADEPTVAETEAVVVETEVVETEAVVESQPVVETEAITPSNDVDFEDCAEKFVDYIFSGAAGSTEIMDKIIAMGNQYLEAKEQGYTFEERMAQLLTPDNIMATAAAAFLVVIGIAFFIFKHGQSKSARLNLNEISRLRELYENEVESNADLREHIKAQNETIAELKGIVTGLSDKSDVTKTDMGHVNKLAIATAEMVKDAFMNSKTIDSSTKNLLMHDYTKALEESEKFGEVSNENK
jgi:hypothetical protein